MNRTSKILGFSVPPAMVKEVEALAKQERRTKSELFREMVRVYQRFRNQRERDEQRWIAELVREAQTERRDRLVAVDEILTVSEQITNSASKRAKKLAIKTDLKSVNDMIHERRKARKMVKSRS